MKARVISLSIASVVLIVALAACYSKSPPHPSVKIIDGRDVPEAIQYAEEFAESLHVATHWNMGEPLSEPHFYFSNVSGELRSPDGVFTLSQRDLSDYYHEITLSRSATQVAESVLVIREGDPGSGTAHAYQWSHDSKAVFIYGWGRPAGHPTIQNMALIYLIEQRMLYSIDLGPLLSNRLQRKSGAQNAPKISRK